MMESLIRTMHVHVKICGITRVEDALEAERLGADAVGFIFYPKSRRYIEPEHARDIIGELGPFIAKVGVFVGVSPEHIRKTVDSAGLTCVQLHGGEDLETVEELGGVCIIRAVRVSPGLSPSAFDSFEASTLLLDTWSADAYGGTGKTFDWSIAETCAEKRRVILAGGLDPGNIRGAVERVKPWGVDVSSGVERAPGIKDHEKLAAFFSALGADGGHGR